MSSRPPKEATRPYLERVAIRYLDRYAGTEARLRRVLRSRVRRSIEAHGAPDRAEAEAWIDALCAKLHRLGYLDDARFAASRASTLPGARVVCGGPHPSVAAEDVLEDAAVDYVVRGEGELTFVELLDGLEDGRTDWSGCQGLSWRGADGAARHEPDRRRRRTWTRCRSPRGTSSTTPSTTPSRAGGVIYAAKEFATLFSSRACPWRCTYCHNSYGKAFRERSADHVLAEIDYLVEEHGVRELVFMDDIFNFRPERAKEIARGLIERDYGLKLTFPNGFRGDILDEELVVLLKRAGMYRCMVAVESAVPRIQKRDEEEPEDRQGAQRIVDFIADAGRDGPRRVHARLPQRDRGRDAGDDRLGRGVSSFHTAAFFRVIPFKGTAALPSRSTHAGFDLPSDWSAVRALPVRHQPLRGAPRNGS